MLHDLWHRIRALIGWRRAEADLRDELQFHLDLEREKAARAGGGGTDAARAARLKFGSLAATAEACRDERGVSAFTDLTRDLRYGLRTLGATPLVTAVALVSLTLGIGANTALFSILDSLILRPLPVTEPDRLVILNGSWTNPIWEQIRARQDDLFDGAFAWSAEAFNLAQGGRTDPVNGAFVSGRLFDVLGVRPALGRLLGEDDDRRGGGAAGPVAVISYGFWQAHFGGAPDVIGQRLTLGRVPFTIVGVMPKRFSGPDVGRSCDVMVPIGTEPLIRGTESFLDRRATWWLSIMARLDRGQTVEQANAALRGVQPQIQEATMPPQFPKGEYLRDPLTLAAAGTGPSLLRETYQQPLLIVSIVVGVILVIACANIASLFLARAAARRKEIGVRLALGASRWRVARQLLVETLLLAAAGAGLGLVFARWTGALLVRQLSTWRESVYLDLTLDWRILAFTTLLATATALLFGLAPALSATRVPASDALRDAGRGTTGDRHLTFRHALVVVQVALSVALVVGAGLFLRTFASLVSVPLGFAPDRLLAVQIDLQPAALDGDVRTPLVERIRQAMAKLPSVSSAATSEIMPLSGAGWNTVIGDDLRNPREHMSWVNAVSPDWFQTYGTRLLEGRDFTAADREGTARVAIVNQAFADRFLGGGPAAGKTFQQRGPSGTPVTYQVVGLVENAVYRSLREGEVPTMYVPMAQEGASSSVTLTLAVRGSRAEVERDLAGTIQSMVPAAAFTFRTFDELTAAVVARERLVAMLSGFFGLLALLLAGIGVYGVTAYAVSRRRAEIGLRMALGARPSNIVRLVIRRVGISVALGLAAGGALALWVARYTESLLFRLEPRDPLTFLLAASAIVIVGGLAAWLPAARAARIDPAATLKE